jgi:hypothetical protein
VVLVVLGLGVAAAPFVFSMFERAPKGRDMIEEFRPFMTRAEVDKFRGFLREIGAATNEAKATVDPAAASKLGLTPAQYGQRVQYLGTLERAWPGIDRDMSDMLDRMQRNLGSYAGVDALPPFSLFPWFFVIPGVLVVGFSGWALVAARRGKGAKGGALVAVIVIGAGLVAAPAVFQMFTRAPHGGDMIDDFRPLMTRRKLSTIQGYFITLGNGESDLRSIAVPAAALPTRSTPAADRFVTDWPRINREMSPFVGVMADNLDNFAAVDALPPFALFPWFFVIPGVSIAGLGFVALRRSRREQPDIPLAPTEPDPGGSVSNARRSAVLTTIVVAALAAVTLAGPAGAKSSPKTTALVGTFTIDSAACTSGSTITGSYFRMINSGGTADGPFIPNADSACTDKSYTALTPGTNGGLRTGKYQRQPNPPFDAAGNGLASAITAPTKFFGVNFAVSTNPTDPVSGTSTKKPRVRTTAKGVLTGDIDAFSVAYGKQQFNQGSPKPDGTKPGLTRSVTGTYHGKFGKFTLEWSSAIVGGPFDGFTGVWHLEGTFRKGK